MKINLAINTAFEGYAWQSHDAYAISKLNKYKKTIGSFPDPSDGTIPYGGIFIYEDEVVFYRYHIAVKSDSKGRDALYVVLGSCPRDAVGKINFRLLFEAQPFAEPMLPYPKEVDFAESASDNAEVSYDEGFEKKYSGVEALSLLGDIFANYPEDNLFIKLAGTSSMPTYSLKYTKRIVEQPTVTMPASEAEEPMPTESLFEPEQPKYDEKAESSEATEYKEHAVEVVSTEAAKADQRVYGDYRAEQRYSGKSLSLRLVITVGLCILLGGIVGGVIIGIMITKQSAPSRPGGKADAVNKEDVKEIIDETNSVAHVESVITNSVDKVDLLKEQIDEDCERPDVMQKKTGDKANFKLKQHGVEGK